MPILVRTRCPASALGPLVNLVFSKDTLVFLHGISGAYKGNWRGRTQGTSVFSLIMAASKSPKTIP
jgi:hypothetical protein